MTILPRPISLNRLFDLPFITSALPGIGGQLRAEANHFVVEELPLYEPAGRGRYIFVNLTKENVTTREVQQELAKLFRLPQNSVSSAGLKDKYARATQTFSLDVGEVNRSFVEDAVRRLNAELPYTINWAKLHTNKLKPGHLLGNRFSVSITGLATPAEEALGRATAIAARLRKNGAANFFGPQRFGAKGENVQKGYDLVNRRSNVRDKWLKRFLISSYQSYLCNRYLVKRIESFGFDVLLTGDIAKKYATGGLFPVEELSIDQTRYDSHEISFTCPMFGSRMWAATGPSGELEAEILAEEGIGDDLLKNFQAKGTRRLGRLLLNDIDIKQIDDGLSVSFSLPKGAFATVVLREIMKVGLENLPEETDE